MQNEAGFARFPRGCRDRCCKGAWLLAILILCLHLWDLSRIFSGIDFIVSGRLKDLEDRVLKLEIPLSRMTVGEGPL
jgi:hypothetical protein